MGGLLLICQIQSKLVQERLLSAKSGSLLRELELTPSSRTATHKGSHVLPADNAFPTLYFPLPFLDSRGSHEVLTKNIKITHAHMRSFLKRDCSVSKLSKHRK